MALDLMITPTASFEGRQMASKARDYVTVMLSRSHYSHSSLYYCYAIEPSMLFVIERLMTLIPYMPVYCSYPSLQCRCH